MTPFSRVSNNAMTKLYYAHAKSLASPAALALLESATAEFPRACIAACLRISFSDSPLVSPNTASISSCESVSDQNARTVGLQRRQLTRVLPFVSGTRKKAHTAASPHHPPKKMYVPKPASSIIGGVIRPTMKLHNQTVAVASATPFDRCAVE